MSAAASWYAVHGPNGDLSWRVTSPAEAIGAKVRLIPDDVGADVLAWPNSGEHFPWHIEAEEAGHVEILASKEAWKAYNSTPHSLSRLTAFYPQHEGEAAVFTRPMAWLAVHGMQLRNLGVRVVAELDDNYMSPSHLNVFMRKAGYGDRDRDDHARSICSADAIIVSTDHLADHYRRMLAGYFGRRERASLPPIHVCRNHVDERHIPTERVPRREDGRLRVGFMGSQSHLWDIDLIWPAMRTAYELGHEIVFVGMDPLVSPISRERMGGRYWDRLAARWSQIEYTVVPWRLDYRGTALPIDIGFAPLVVNEYTLCKSDIKWLELAMSGAACVAQNCLVYNRTAVHGETALLAGSPDEYVAHTLALLRDEGLRERLVANTMQYVTEERLLSDHVDEWREAVLGA